MREGTADGHASTQRPLRRASDIDAIARIAGDEAHLAQRVLDSIPGVLVTVLDRDFRIVSVRSGAEIAGFSDADLPGKDLLALLPADEATALATQLAPVLHGEERSFLFHRADRDITYSMSAGPLLDDGAAVVGVILTARDITAQIKAEERVAVQLERFLDAFEHAPLPMVILNADGTIRLGNTEMRSLVGRPATQFTGHQLSALVDPRDQERLHDVLAGLLSGEVPRATVEARLLLAGAAPVSCLLHGTARSANDPDSGVTIQIVDQTERHRHDAQLRYLTGHDTLTGLVNRARFEDAVETHLADCARYGYDGAVLLVNVDHFRQINDAQGHSAGDQQLIELTGLLQRGRADGSIIARVGGDEFGVLLSSGDLPSVMRAAENLLAAAHDHARAARAAGRVSFTLSIGIAMCTPEAETSADLLALAEHAVSAAKRGGRDRIAVPEEIARAGDRRSQTAIGRLRRAIRDERFELHAQPIVRLSDDQVSQYELLVRLRDEDGELVPPGAFLPLAEHYGLIGEIDAWVTRKALEALEAADDTLCLQVNLSGRSLAHPALMDTITEGLSRHADSASQLVFELTETAAIANVSQALAFADRLRTLGCALALDDFGAGFGGLHYLKHLPFQYVKIDGQFVSDVSRSLTDQVIVDGILAITRGMGVRTVAEFVGDQGCLEHLRSVGVDYAQGFHLGRPRPLEELLFDLHHPPPKPRLL